jgi:hypothetical protein
MNFLEHNLDIPFTQKIIKSFKTKLEKEFKNEFNANSILEDLKKTYEDKTNIVKFLKESQLFQNHSRTIHELKQLPEKLQKIIYSKINKIYGKTINGINNNINISQKNIIKSSLNNLIIFINYIINENLDMINQFHNNNNIILGNIIKILNIPTNFTVSLVDIYTISRAFKMANDPFPSHLSIIYLGNYHIINIIEILSDIYEKIEEWGDSDLKFRNEKLKEGSKCILKKKINQVFSIPLINSNSFKNLSINSLSRATTLLTPKNKKSYINMDENEIRNFVKSKRK